MTLVTNHVVSDTGHTSDHNAIATQVNANTLAIATAASSSPWINAKDAPYGAAGNGTTDDTAAIQAALDAAAATVTSTTVTLNGGAVYVGPGTGGNTVFLPAGTYRVTSTLFVKGLTRLEGAGWATLIKAAAGVTGAVIKASGDKMFGSQLANFRVDATAATSGHGVEWQGSASSFAAYYSTNNAGHSVGAGGQVMETVFIVGAKSDGLHLDDNVSGLNVHNVICASSGQYGFYCGVMYDCDFTQCVSGGSVGSGVYIAPGSAVNRYSDFKVYGAGQTTNDPAWYIRGPQHTFVNCEAEENQGNGFYIDTGASKTVMRACRAQGAGTYGVSLNASNCEVDIYCEDGYGFTATAAVQIGAGTGSRVRVQTAIATAIAGTVIGNYVSVNADEGVQQPAYTASLAVDPYAGGIVQVTLTGNITITTTRSHAGARLKFILSQDSTGTRTTTFGPEFKTSWTPSTTASQSNVIEFVHDGTHWVQVAVTTGLTGVAPLLLDTFTGAATTAGLPAADTGQTWTAVAPSTWGLDGNGKAYVPTSSNAASSFTVTDVGTGDVDLTLVISNVGSNDYPGFVVRYADTSNYLLVQVNITSGNLELHKVVAGAATLIGSYAAGITTASSHTLRGICKGTAWTVYLDGVSRITVTDGALSTNTKIGPREGGVANGTSTSTFDSLTVYAA